MENKSDFLAELYEGCRTYRRFKQEPISEEILRAIISNASKASRSRNSQVLRYAVVSSPEKVAEMQPLAKWAGALPPEIGTPKEGEQPTAWIAIYHEGETNHMLDIDTGIAVNTITTTAWSYGIGSCIMGAINVPAIKKLLDIPEDASMFVVVALGVPDHTSTIVPVPKDGELKYYVDENRDYYVPKFEVGDVARFV